MNDSIRVICATGMPEGVLVWVDPRAAYTVVYADASLCREGRLTPAGEREIEAALHREAFAV
ncbi:MULTISPECIES: hypothetical protein [unclassified Streptomyces]|uniref:hypothetical protein n=1 Tax=unclassified Streptomyces TaxID=2593676 RepID=UPI00081F45E1|nr:MULTISPECIES: hypothetical protein [unclassified Streptomyces]MYR28066.1 hypothetical protein [Streptomyces sp. SID4945]SCF33348.1 hypothetical protein GA0115257_111622 [Streptomyces sp. LcepLS]